MTYRLGIDVGGTFTDFVLLHPTDWSIWTHKQLTTPTNPVRGILAGLAALLEKAGLAMSDVADAHVVHGTTLVTNALIERKGARVGLITTRGARDVLETGKENRYDPFDRHISRHPPLIERRLRRELDERMASDGTILVPLDLRQVEVELDRLEGAGVESLAVCLLYAYRNPAHETVVGDRAARRGFSVSLSSVVSPEIGEWERVSTTAANAYVQPFTARYLTELSGALAGAGFRRGFYVMLSDGGIAAPEDASRIPIRILESGPAGGVQAAALYARLLGLEDVIAFDMGGTTAKISLVHAGTPARASSFEVARADRLTKGSGIPLRVPTVEMLEIGAGGGSLARLDDMGLLKVGPQSAGADPGPASYGRGGSGVTVTDANLLLGYLPDGARLGDDLYLDRSLAAEAAAPIARTVAESVEDTALGVRRVVNEAMAHAVKLHATEKGRDPRSYVLFAFGGAGPLHACAVAQSLGIRRVVVPSAAGVLASLGFITARPAVELTRSFLGALDALDVGRLLELAAGLADQATPILAAAGVRPDRMRLQYTLDMRYAGQGYDVPVQMTEGPLDALDPVGLRERFDASYRSVYGLELPDSPVEVRTLRLWATGPEPEVRLPGKKAVATPDPLTLRELRQVRLDDGTATESPVYELGEIPEDGSLSAPCLIQDLHTTTVVPPRATCRVDGYGNLSIELPPTPAWQRSAGNDLSAVDVEILMSRLRTIMDECDRTILRTAFSAVVREGKDYAVGLSDAEGRALALPTETMPLFVTCMPRSISLLISRFPPHSLKPGDVLITNDPWVVAGHKHDLFVLQPVFHHERIVAFIGAVSHLPDAGGIVGDFRAWDLFEEGVMIPPMRLLEEGRPNETLIALLRANVRLPVEVMGDVRALLAALSVGETRLQEFLHDTGLEDFGALSREIGTRAAHAFRRAAGRIPPGDYSYAFAADGTGGPEAADDAIHVRVTLRARADGLAVDYAGTSPQLSHFPINVPIPYTLADTIYALHFLLSPQMPNVAPSYDLVSITAPEGCILNAVSPVPVYARTRTGVHITTAICGALVQAAPELAMAGCGHNVILKIAGMRDDGSYFGIGLMPKGGMGATADLDGWNVTVYPTNCTMVPTEVLETLGPLQMDREILMDSGGPGRRRGGTGQRVTLRSRSNRPVTISVRSNFVHHPPPGFEAGHSGGTVRALLNGKPIPSNPVTLNRGDALLVETAGGGGFGDPLQREPERVLEDVRQGYSSLASARSIYGVVIAPETMVVDEAATAYQRKNPRGRHLLERARR